MPVGDAQTGGNSAVEAADAEGSGSSAVEVADAQASGSSVHEGADAEALQSRQLLGAATIAELDGSISVLAADESLGAHSAVQGLRGVGAEEKSAKPAPVQGFLGLTQRWANNHLSSTGAGGALQISNLGGKEAGGPSQISNLGVKDRAPATDSSMEKAKKWYPSPCLMGFIVLAAG